VSSGGSAGLMLSCGQRVCCCGVCLSCIEISCSEISCSEISCSEISCYTTKLTHAMKKSKTTTVHKSVVAVKGKGKCKGKAKAKVATTVYTFMDHKQQKRFDRNMATLTASKFARRRNSADIIEARAKLFEDRYELSHQERTMCGSSVDAVIMSFMTGTKLLLKLFTRSKMPSYRRSCSRC
jgi:hypothetical protein